MKPENDTSVMVSVCTLTYNHERFIAKAIDGILMQEVDFPYEIIIHDDASTDGTADIIRDYEARHPDIITAIYQTENQLSKSIRLSATHIYPKVRGKYIAFCEGDDYWIDPHKLQAQVELLESSPQFGMCFTNSLIVDEHERVISESRVPADKKKHLDQSDVLSGFCPPMNTLLVRADMIRDIAQSAPANVRNMDFYFAAIITNTSGIGYIDTVTATYRKHQNSSWSSRPQEVMDKNLVNLYAALLPRVLPENTHYIDQHMKTVMDRLQRVKPALPARADMNVKNIVISGTNFWNPGDDFVRDGVIRVLHGIFPDAVLNFMFYNFNGDFFPQKKFTGIHNMLSEGDIDHYADFVDAVVIAGLSAGNEIKDLYAWIIANKLTDRVYMIGAGYENDYVAEHILKEPEKTIFQNAQVITGRTKKHPALIDELQLPYHHINCPALLSVPNVKEVLPGKQIEKIALSIQLPVDVGVVNQVCSKKMHDLSLTILHQLYREYELTIIAHHKSEYFYFLNYVRDHNLHIGVQFSSFYQELFTEYPKYDLVVTTRLHSSLFGNGCGIPGIILNDTDRHTHCLEGFEHSFWVNTIDAFNARFAAVLGTPLDRVASELRLFKEALLAKYITVLSPYFFNTGSAAPGTALNLRLASGKIVARTSTHSPVH